MVLGQLLAISVRKGMHLVLWGLASFAGALLLAVAPASADGQFTTLEAPFTQSLYGVQSVDNLFGGVAFAPNGDPLADDCQSTPAGPLYRFNSATTLPPVHGSTALHPVSTETSTAGCGLTNHPDGALYSNTSGGVIELNASTGAQVGGPFGPAGSGLGIAVDPQTGNLAYVGEDGSIDFVDPALTRSGTLSTVTSNTSAIDQIAYDPTGNFLFVSDPDNNQIVILHRDGTLAQDVPLTLGNRPDGIAFHTNPAFVITNNNDGTITRFDFPNNDYTQPPTQSVFASGGFRGDNLAVGSDGCLYLTQEGTRYDDGTVDDTMNSLLQICPGFKAAPGAPQMASPPPPSVRACPTSRVRLGSVRVLGALGHRAWDLALRNAGSVTCTLRGYPTVRLLNRGHRVITRVRVRHAPGFSEPTIVLSPGGRVFFTLLWAAAGPCVPHFFYAYGISVTPPGSSHARKLRHPRFDVCSPALGGPPSVTPIRKGLKAS
jgi:hypothetical protein